ncbi:MAG: ribonuclease Z, partial [Longimicrobiales bacterium]|nr:ribonuclease Z [Longimicrobiales bacterium]
MKPGVHAVLTVVGSGTLLPDASRGSASFHLDLADPDGGPSHSLLLDAGPGTLHGLPGAGVPWRSIDTIAVSHFHPDHVSDLPALLAAFRFEGLEEPLTLVGSPGLDDFVEKMAALHGDWIRSPSRPLEVVEVGEGEAWVSDDGIVRLEAHPTPHTRESVAFRVGTPEASSWVLGYTGDTGPSADVGDFLKGCAVMIAECALTDPPEMDTHLSPASLARLATEAAPDLLLVSHVYPPQTPREAVDAVRSVYPGAVAAAEDGLR